MGFDVRCSIPIFRSNSYWQNCTMLEETSESELVERLRKGDPEAFAVLYRKYKVPLAYRILQLIKDEVFAEELLQELFVAVWEQRAQLDSSRSFKAYLYRIATNKTFNFMRRASKNREILLKIRLSSTELYQHIEERLYEKENEELLTKIIDQLPPQRRKIFSACKIDGKSYKEVAEEFGISPHTVNDHIQKSLLFLRKHLKNESTLLLIYCLCT